MDRQDVLDWKRFLSRMVRLLEHKARYADVLLTDIDELIITKDKDSMDVNRSSERGVKLRAFDGEQFWEYGVSGFDKLKIEDAVSVLLSKIEHKDGFDLDFDFKTLVKDFRTKQKKDPLEVPLKEKTAFVEKLQEKILSANPLIINAKAIYEEVTEKKIFVNRHRQLYQDIKQCLVIMLPFVRTDDGDVRYHYESVLKPGYEVTNISDKQIKKVTDMVVRIREAKKITPGKYQCLLSPKLSGLLAHESFGHGMESDTVYKDRAKAKEYIGKKIAPKYVSIVDNPAYPNRNGSYFFDDEGEIASETYLIKNGIVKNPITEMYSASLMNLPRSANGRAESFDHKNYARMSNTYFLPGKDKPSEMLKTIKDGLYLYHSMGGMEDPKGWGVQIQGILAEKVKNGKLTGELFYEVGMTGFLPTILSNIKKVGNKLEVEGTGQCGKGHKEWVRVSEGGAHLLINDVDLS